MRNRGIFSVGRGILVLALVMLAGTSALAGGGGGGPSGDFGPGPSDTYGYYYTMVLDPTFATNGEPLNIGWLTGLVEAIGTTERRPGDYYWGLVVPVLPRAAGVPASDTQWARHLFPSGSWYGTTDEMMAAIVDEVSASTDPEGIDGLEGIVEAALYPWSSIMILVTDGAHEDWGGTVADAEAALGGDSDLRKKLNVIVDHDFGDGQGTPAMGTYWNAYPDYHGSIKSFRPKSGGGYGEANGHTRLDGAAGVYDNYIQLAANFDGSGWDMDEAVDENGVPSGSFRKAWEDVKIEELGGFGGGGVPEPSTFALMLSAMGVLGILARRRRRG